LLGEHNYSKTDIPIAWAFSAGRSWKPNSNRVEVAGEADCKVNPQPNIPLDPLFIAPALCSMELQALEVLPVSRSSSLKFPTSAKTTKTENTKCQQQ